MWRCLTASHISRQHDHPESTLEAEADPPSVWLLLFSQPRYLATNIPVNMTVAPKVKLVDCWEISPKILLSSRLFTPKFVLASFRFSFWFTKF